MKFFNLGVPGVGTKSWHRPTLISLFTLMIFFTVMPFSLGREKAARLSTLKLKHLAPTNKEKEKRVKEGEKRDRDNEDNHKMSKNAGSQENVTGAGKTNPAQMKVMIGPGKDILSKLQENKLNYKKTLQELNLKRPPLQGSVQIEF